MDAVVGALRAGLSYFAKPFLLLGDFWGLTLLSAIVGILILVLVGKTTPQKLVERARNRMASSIYEIRLYIDSPKRILLSQGRLIVSSFAYVLAMLPAFLLMSIPIWLLYLQLEPRFGMDPLEINQPTVMSLALADGVDASSVSMEEGSIVSDGAIVVEESGNVFMRVKPTEAGTHSLQLNIAGNAVTKKFVVGEGKEVFPERSSGSHYWGESFGTESRLRPSVDGATRISFVHPSSSRRFLGMPWWIYSLIVMTLAAFGLKDRLGVTL